MMQGWWGERALSLLGRGPNCGESATCPRIILRIDAARSAPTAATRKKTPAKLPARREFEVRGSHCRHHPIVLKRIKSQSRKIGSVHVGARATDGPYAREGPWTAISRRMPAFSMRT